MIETMYYAMTHGEYKKHAHRIQGHWQSSDEKLRDASPVILKATGEEHMHEYLEKQPGVHPCSPPIATHPLVKMRRPV